MNFNNDPIRVFVAFALRVFNYLTYLTQRVRFLQICAHNFLNTCKKHQKINNIKTTMRLKIKASPFDLGEEEKEGISQKSPQSLNCFFLLQVTSDPCLGAHAVRGGSAIQGHGLDPVPSVAPSDHQWILMNPHFRVLGGGHAQNIPLRDK